MRQSDPISLRAVNGWRGPGALAIAIGHFAVATDFIAKRHLEPLALLVDVFFVFSGLVIAQVYTETLSRASAIPEYIVRRFGRIWPLQAATLAVLVCYELAKLVAQTLTGRHFSSPAFSPDSLNLVGAIPTNLLLIHALGLHDRETWNFPSWSLSVEFFTYAVFALFCLASPWLRRGLSVVTIAASLAILVVVAPYHMRSTFDYGVFRCLAGFFAGSLCYDALRRWPLPTWPLPTFVEVLAVVMVIVWMSVCVGTWLAFAAPFVFCLFIVAFVQERGLLSRAMLTKPALIMAELSFSIYMVHGIVLIFLFGILHEYERRSGQHLFTQILNPLAGYPGAPATVHVLHVGTIFSRWGLGAVYLAAVLVLAYGVFKFVEVPGRAFFSGLAKRLRTMPSRPSARVGVAAKSMEPSP